MKTRIKTETIRKAGWVLFGCYLAGLVYFMFFAESLGRTEVSEGYRYNLKPFLEIRRCIRYWDVTVSVCERFQTAGLNLEDEVLPLAAYGQFLKGEFEGVHIITKGGSQGGSDAINRCITYLKEKLYI